MRRSKKNEHKQYKKELMPPLTTLPGDLKLVDWNRELLPEFIWIESLASMYGRLQANYYYSMLLDALDEYERADEKQILDGTVTSFGNYSAKTKKAFVIENAFVIEKCINAPFGDFLELYPKSPMRWLTLNQEPKYKQLLSKKEVISEVSTSVNKLFMAKDEYTGLIRALPLNRYFKHTKISIPPIKELIHALEIYPEGTRDEQYRVESFARNFVNMHIMMQEAEKDIPYKWSKYFWDKNSKLARCRDE